METDFFPHDEKTFTKCIYARHIKVPFLLLSFEHVFVTQFVCELRLFICSHVKDKYMYSDMQIFEWSLSRASAKKVHASWAFCVSVCHTCMHRASSG